MRFLLLQLEVLDSKWMLTVTAVIFHVILPILKQRVYVLSALQRSCDIQLILI